jgi:hypothetical protein
MRHWDREEGMMRKRLAGLVLPILFGLASCGHDDAAASAQLKTAMSDVKAAAEAVLAGRQPVTRAGLAELSRQIVAADQAIDKADDAARALEESPGIEAAALDYLKSLRQAVDQTRDRYASAITLDEAKAADLSVSQAIHQAQDEATLERARVDADTKAGAVDAAVALAGNAVVERERRLEALMTALQHGAQQLPGYSLVSHDALATAMASNVTASAGR